MKRFIIVSCLLSLISYNGFSATTDGEKTSPSLEKNVGVLNASSEADSVKLRSVGLEPVKAPVSKLGKEIESKASLSRSIEKKAQEKTFFEKLKGLEVGFGLPLVPTGYNAFIGYINKDAESFWGKRIGARLDFQIPSATDVEYTIGDCVGEKCDIKAKTDLLFFSKTFNTDMNELKFDSDDDGIDDPVDTTGMNGKFAIDNWNIGGLVDFYPFGDTWVLSGLRLTGGYYLGSMNITLQNNMPNDLPNADGWRYNVEEVSETSDKIIARINGGSKISADFRWAYSGPYLGLGFDLGVLFGFKFYMDAGVVFSKPPKFQRKNIRMPVLSACYLINGETECGNPMTYDLNEKPLVNDWIVGITAGMLGSKINDESMDPETKTAIASALGISSADLATHDFTNESSDILYYINSDPGDPAPEWIQAIIEDTASPDESTAIMTALNNVRDNWTGGTNLSTSLQADIDDAWADYEKGIDDLNDSLKKMQFMPVIKLGVMYRF